MNSIGRARPVGAAVDPLFVPCRAASEPFATRLAGVLANPFGLEAATASRPANNFDGLRLLAALMIMFGHALPDRTGTFGLRLLLFFAISGYLVSASWNADPHLGRFLVRRALRVWPAYAAMVVLCAGLTWLFPARDLPDISRMASWFYLTNLWFAGFDWGFFPSANPLLNQTMWALRFEVDFYVALAVVGWLGRRWLPWSALVVLAASLRAPETRAPVVGGFLECWSLYFAGFFAFGILLRAMPSLRATRAVVIMVSGGIALLWTGERTAGLLFVIVPAAIWIGERSWPGLRSASRLGDLSMGTFLWAWPVHQFTGLWVADGTSTLARLVLELAQVLALAWLSWHGIERRALAHKPRAGGSALAEGRRSRRAKEDLAVVLPVPEPGCSRS